VRGTREKVERTATGRDVGREKCGDGFGVTARAVALESFERDVVHALHGRSDCRASGRGLIPDAAPNPHRVLPFDVVAAGRDRDFVDDGGRFLEPSRRVPDTDPAVREASGAAEREVGATSDDDRNG